MKKRIRKFLSKKSNWTSAFTLVLAFICLGISFAFTQLSYQVISAMFLFIAVESFIDKFIHMEDIRTRLDELKPQDSGFVELKTRRESKLIVNTIKEAKHELFISGINLHTLSGLDKEILLRAKDGVQIRILVFDVYDKALLETFEKMVGRKIKGPRSTFVFLRHFLDCENIKIKQADFIMPAMFMAYDMDKDYGYIKAEHFLNERDNSELPSIELTPDKDWYNNYKSHIEDLWKKGKPYEPKEEDR